METQSRIAGVTKQQLSFIRLLDEYEINIFTLENIHKKVGLPLGSIKEITERLIQKGFLIRLEKGKFCRHNFNDEWVISNYLVKDGVVAYWSALNRHGLTEQFPNTVFVQTTKEKKEKNILGVNYKFIRVAKRKLTGFKMYGFGNNQFRMSDIEKTIVDCFDLPEYSGGYAELLHAFNMAQVDNKQLTKYCKIINNIAATKRIGFLAELLQKQHLQPFLKYAKEMVNEKYNLFDPFGSDSGEHINEWKLRLNISKEEILSICNKTA